MSKAPLIDRVRGRAAAHKAKATGDHSFDAELLAEAGDALTAAELTLHAALEYFEAREDINHEGTGPNAAMSLATEIRATLRNIEGTR